MALLPMQIGNDYLYRESDIITLTSDSGFTLECNIKFQICIFEVSGKYVTKYVLNAKHFFVAHLNVHII